MTTETWRQYSVDLSGLPIVTECENLYQDLSKDSKINKFGEPNDPCLRLKNKNRKFKTITRKISIDNETRFIKLTKSSISFINKYKCYPDNIIDESNNWYCISHLCGNKLCIQANHMIIETQKNNVQRWKCHNYINAFINKYQIDHKLGIHDGLACKLFVDYVRNKYNQYDSDMPIHYCSHDNNYNCFISFRKL